MLLELLNRLRKRFYECILALNDNKVNLGLEFTRIHFIVEVQNEFS